MKLTIVGSGLAGATAAAMLKSRYDVTVYEADSSPGGMLRDHNGVQRFGPRAFHTDDEEAWRFVNEFADFRPFDLRVHVQTDPRALIELPRRAADDDAFRIYSEKAWGKPFDQLPAFIRDRVPGTCTDGRVGYHAGRYKGQPVGGYSAMIARMLDGVQVQRDCLMSQYLLPHGGTPVIWTGDINDYSGGSLPWVCRQWTHAPHARPFSFDTGGHVINHATWNVPQIRSYDCNKINPYHPGPGVVVEWPCANGAGVPCYPAPDESLRLAADAIVRAAKRENHWLCGRLATYQYLDMDKTIRQVMDTIEEANL